MFGIGPMEMIVIAIVAIVFIGPERLPEVMRKFGKIFVQIRRQTNEVKSTFNEAIQDAERDFEIERLRELQHKLASSTPTQILEASMQDNAGHIPSHRDAPKILDSNGHPLAATNPNPPAPAPAPTLDYHEGHYVDGKYLANSESFVPWDASMDKPLSEIFPIATDANAINNKPNAEPNPEATPSSKPHDPKPV